MKSRKWGVLLVLRRLLTQINLILSSSFVSLKRPELYLHILWRLGRFLWRIDSSGPHFHHAKTILARDWETHHAGI